MKVKLELQTRCGADARGTCFCQFLVTLFFKTERQQGYAGKPPGLATLVDVASIQRPHIKISSRDLLESDPWRAQCV
jgi:hypothetical protein